uniref:Concanavalin A-like lectin/glucanase n=1 Tax=Rhizophagus irregularis (strain DAOM 181602 / DAOM 197198 / MUCL 43194) TaxID=747089 RepID=U9U8L7_RHIID
MFKITFKLTTLEIHLGGGNERERLVRTPGLFLHANNSKLYPRFTGNWNDNVGINTVGDRLLLNKWYHITYTLSDTEKRMDIFINGVWTAFYAIENVQMHRVKFNDKQLDIGWCVDGEIRHDFS